LEQFGLWLVDYSDSEKLKVKNIFMAESILKIKSYKFALRIIKLAKFLNQEKKEFILSKQVIRSGTAIGALIREAEFGQSKLDFISKMSIALKEANETEYWLNLLKDSDYISTENFYSMDHDCLELVKLLVSSIKTTKQNLVKN
jgi:four helix bundle protein